ncbi:hypothetical protein ES703_39613 [subsurface metagenome]
MPEKQGGFTKYASADKASFATGGDAWQLLTISDTMEIVLDEHGFIRDAWDSKSKKTYDTLGNETGTRDTTYTLPPDSLDPKDMTDEALEDALKAKRWDYSKESRSIAHQQKALKGKLDYMTELTTELSKRKLRRSQGHGYMRRTPVITLGGMQSGFRPTSIRTYKRFWPKTRYVVSYRT